MWFCASFLCFASGTQVKAHPSNALQGDIKSTSPARQFPTSGRRNAQWRTAQAQDGTGNCQPGGESYVAPAWETIVVEGRQLQQRIRQQSIPAMLTLCHPVPMVMQITNWTLEPYDAWETLVGDGRQLQQRIRQQSIPALSANGHADHKLDSWVIWCMSDARGRRKASAATDPSPVHPCPPSEDMRNPHWTPERHKDSHNRQHRKRWMALTLTTLACQFL